MNNVFSQKPKIVFAIIGIVILVGLVGGGYYWWTGTPEYSAYQIKKAVETQDKELGLKYIDVDAIFENLWTDWESEFAKGALKAEGFEAFGMMLGSYLAESMKPGLKELTKQEIENWFSVSEEKLREESTGKGLKLGATWKEKLKIKRQDKSAHIELPDGIKIIFIRKEGERYWVITKIEGLMQDFSTGEGEQEKKDDFVFIEKNIGDTIELATLKFKINKAEEKQSLVHSLWGVTATAREDAKFILISMDVTNITKDAFDFNFKDVPLIDQNERKFLSYERSIGSVDNYLQMQRLSPGIKESGFIVYELPKDATSYSLVIGKTGTNEVYKVILK